MPQHGDAGGPRDSLLEQPEALGDQLGTDEGRPGHVAVRPRQTGDQPVTDRIGHPPDDDRNGSGCLLSRAARRRAHCNDHIDVASHQVSCQLGQPIQFPIGKSAFDGDVLSLDVTKVAQPLQERVETCGNLHWAGHQRADPRHLLQLLRACRERPGGRRAAEKRDELASSHSITSSGRSRN